MKDQLLVQASNLAMRLAGQSATHAMTECGSQAIAERPEWTAQGHRRFRWRRCWQGGSAAAPHIGARYHQRFWSVGIIGLEGCPNQCPTISEGEDMSPKRILGLAIAASTLASSAALAATGTPERVRGTIASAAADAVTVDTYANTEVSSWML